MTIATGQPMLADDILRLNFLPIGTIMMYDGASGWVDNSTIPGWYACTAANVGRDCPNLVNSFIKGADSRSNVKAGGHSNHEVAVNLDNLPEHTHVIGGSTGNMSANDSGWFKSENCRSYGADGATFTTTREGDAPWNGSGDGSGRITMNIQHTHALPASTGNNATTAAKLDIEPQSYALIYIRKCE
jgi:hypothetical protein